MQPFNSLLLPYQRRFVEDASRFKIWLAARQIGKSTAVSYEAVSLAAERPRTAILLVSASQRQSLELLEKVRTWTQALKLAVAPAVIERETTEEVRLSNGSRIVSLPANPATIRGFSGHIFLDEFAFHKDSRKIWAAIFPTITRGYFLRITSTPNGRQNMFYDLWSHGEDWAKHLTSIYDAQANGLDVDVAALKSGTPDADTWAQEYECQFVDEATAFLTFDLINQAESDDAGRPELYARGPCYLGGDIGRRRDLTVYWAIEKVGDVFWTREISILAKAPFAVQDAELARLISIYHPHRVCLDQTGLGERSVEEAKTRYGRYRVEGILFTGPVKQDLATHLRRLFEDRKLRIPADAVLRQDLHSVRKVTTAAGNVRFDAERTDDGHADRFWALSLAAHAAGQPSAMPIITTPAVPIRAARQELRAY